MTPKAIFLSIEIFIAAAVGMFAISPTVRDLLIRSMISWTLFAVAVMGVIASLVVQWKNMQLEAQSLSVQSQLLVIVAALGAGCIPMIIAKMA